jgi:transcriptional regulator with XRE-family HTH domain
MPTLKKWRARRLLTVRALATAAGVAPTTVYLVETGRSAPTFRVIRALSEALGVQPEEVVEFAAAIEAVGQGKAGAAWNAA